MCSANVRPEKYVVNRGEIEGKMRGLKRQYPRGLTARRRCNRVSMRYFGMPFNMAICGKPD
jgi:hypothetical protein